MTKITYIPGEIANAAIDEHGNRKPVTRTQHVFDDAKGKSQAEVNADIDDALALHQSEINALNSQNYVTVDSFNALPATGEADTVYRVSNWDGTQQDPTVYSEYAWNGSQYVHLSTKTQIGEVFDISAYHATGGTLATYADLTAALGTNGANVPQSLRKGGMSVKYVQTSDNKYVQYRYMSDDAATVATFTNVANWQSENTDKNITAGSRNLAESGDVHNNIQAVNSKFDIELGETIDFSDTSDRVYYNVNGTAAYNQNRQRTRLIPVKDGDSFTYFVQNTDTVYEVCALDKDFNLVPSQSVGGTAAANKTYTVASGQGIKYLIFCNHQAPTPFVRKSSYFAKLLKEGYIYCGIATPSSSPITTSGNKFYFAHEKGTYTNFGGIELTANGIFILKYNGSSWTSQTITAADAFAVGGSINYAESSGIAFDLNAIMTKILIELGESITLSDSATLPYYGTDGRAFYNTNREKTTPILVKTGDVFKVTLGQAGSVYSIVAFDAEHNIVTSASISQTLNNYNYTVPEGVKFVIFVNSHASQASPSVVKVSTVKGEIDGLKGSVEETNGKVDIIGFTSNKELNNIIEELYLDLSNESFTLADIKSVNVYKNDGNNHNYGIALLNASNSVLKAIYYSYTSEQSNPPVFVCYNYGTMIVKLNWGLITDTNKNYVAGINAAATIVDYSPEIKREYFVEKANLASRILNRNYDNGIDFDFSLDASRLYYNSTSKQNNTNRCKTELIAVSENDIIDYSVINSTNVYQIAALNSNKALVTSVSALGTGSVVTGRYIVPAGVNYLIFCSNAAAISTSYARLYPNKKKVNKVLPVKIVGFDGFSGTGWTISSDKKTATNSAGGTGKLVYPTQTYEDKFVLSASIVATGSTFEAFIGKWNTWAGTVFSLYYDGTNSYLRSYKKDSTSANPQLTNTLQLTNVTLASGKKIYIRIEKKTELKLFFNVTVSDEFGNKDFFEYIGDYTHHFYTSNGWGQVCAYLGLGNSMVVSDLSFGYPIADDLRVIFLGHSYIEGTSINPMSAMKQRWDYLLCEDLGLDNTLIAAHGGEKTTGLLEYIDTYADWFRNAKYAIVGVGENDLEKPNGQDQTVTQEELDACIANSELIAQKLMAQGIIPIWLVSGGKVASYQNGVDYLQGYNDWMRSQPYFIDVSNVVKDANGLNNDPNKYLDDATHWKVDTHTLIYNVVKAQAGYLLK